MFVAEKPFEGGPSAQANPSMELRSDLIYHPSVQMERGQNFVNVMVTFSEKRRGQQT